MDPINWEQYDGRGEFVERFLCTMLHNRHPLGIHRNPSQGDGGIDFHIKSEGTHEVFQVKSFCGGRFADGRKRQIRESFDTARKQNPEMTTWHLVTPMNPTMEAENWFNNLVEDCGFKADWLHQTFCDTLIASYPSIARYFIEDRYDEFKRLLDDFKGFTGSGAEIPSSVGGVSGAINILARRLDEINPYYRFYVETHPADFDPLPVDLPTKHPDGMVFAVSIFGRDSVFGITVRVVARYRQATEDMPLSFSAKFNAQVVLDAELHHQFGQAIELPGSEVSTPKMLSGIAPDITNGTVRIVPSYSPITGYRRLVAAPANLESELASFELIDGGHTKGITTHLGKWHDRSGLFTMTSNARLDSSEGRVFFNLRLTNLVPRSCRHVVRTLLTASKPENVLMFEKPADSEPSFGTANWMELAMPEVLEAFEPTLSVIDSIAYISTVMDIDYRLEGEFDTSLSGSIMTVRQLLEMGEVTIPAEPFLPVDILLTPPDSASSVVGKHRFYSIDRTQRVKFETPWMSPQLDIDQVSLRFEDLSIEALDRTTTEGNAVVRIVCARSVRLTRASKDDR